MSAIAGGRTLRALGPVPEHHRRPQLPCRAMERTLPGHGRRGPLEHRPSLLHDDTLKPEDRLWRRTEPFASASASCRSSFPHPSLTWPVSRSRPAAAMPFSAGQSHTGCSPAAGSAGRSVPGPWARGSANSASGLRKPALPPCSSSPPSILAKCEWIKDTGYRTQGDRPWRLPRDRCGSCPA